MITSALVIISCFLIWNLLSALEGYIRAHYEDYLYYSDRKHPNLHGWYMVIRGFVLLPFAFVVYQECSFSFDSQWLWIICGLLFYGAGIMSYSLFYLGVLYTYRNKLAPEIYKKRFFANKEPGEDKNAAKMELSFWVRTAFFFIACCFISGIILQLYGL